MRVGPGNENNDEICFDFELASHEKTLGDYLDVVLAEPAEEGGYDGVFANRRMCWFLYSGYADTKTNPECRH